MTAPASLHHVTVGDTSLAVHAAGAGLPLLLLHGFPLDHAMWSAQEPLAEHVRLIVPDQRGFGASTGSTPASIEQLADDAAGLLAALRCGPAVVCGLSMGGYVAQHLAVRHPDRVRGLVLVDTKLESDTPEARAARADLAAKTGRLGQRIVADAMVPRLLATSAEARDSADRATIEAALHAAILRQPVMTIQAALAALGSRPDMTAAMRDVRVPTLLVVGAEDAITPPACMATALEVMPHARLLVVPQAGHMTPLEAPDVFNRAVRGFLAEAGLHPA
jgi:pimeloyl-ACP methyl ester carboxylesterase